MMKKLIPALFTLSLGILTSCADQYKVLGTTNVHGMEGQMLYLKTFHQDDMKTLDSCRVTHGKFQFTGQVDSVVMANMFMGDEGGMPVVLEGGELTIRLDELEQRVTGGPLNDTLYNFIRHKSQIENQLSEIAQREGRMVMDGIDHDEVVRILGRQADSLMAEHDRLETNFIKQNYNNVLGPGVFMFMTSGFDFPILTPQIEEIVATATPYFLNHPYVKGYLHAAEQNMEKLQGQ